MTMLSSLYVLPFLCNCLLVSSSILTPLKADGNLRIFKNVPSDFEYVLKRHSVDSRPEDADSKERRSNKGSSFIRFGRSDPDNHGENVLGEESDGSSPVNRYPRWKSPDIVIRFGRSDSKTAPSSDRDYKLRRNDLNFIRFGRNSQTYPLEIDVTTMCSDLVVNEETKSSLQPFEARLLRLCDALSNFDAEHRNALDFLEERAGSKHE
ncbi:FMRFamide-related peptides [Megalopta genalis]|uniref:FMRFamide-related peptides n=1 Tax=Megalopta genalis TaxID=115081 RepID=UPI0014435B99|nr:FMRFamide-related peptides-like [Megalopta genalis]